MIRDWRAEHRARLKKKNGRPRDRTGERARGLYVSHGHGGSRWVWRPSDRTLGPTSSGYCIVSGPLTAILFKRNQAHATVDGTK
ncbi:unnamed protein product [Fusarium graminearum]|nr:unnamed protein product [Fusarium graminearum]CAG1962202.1 unnamed protein product [Fusarium graminearum]CAG1964238.1 unnamed protein product [Fusarium graminearum]VTO86089.1 unnamed protein product [Fusarium graminearum]